MHHKERVVPPHAPLPPSGDVGVNTNVPRLRIRKDEWRDERSPQRIQHGGRDNHMMSGGRGGNSYGQQVARRETYPTRFSGIPPEVPSVPGLHWP